MASPSHAVVPTARDSWLSRRPWLPAFTAVLALLAASAAVWLDYKPNFAAQLILACAACLCVGLLLGVNWRRLLGPVFAYDVVRTARQGRGFAHRFLYGSLLLTVLLIVFSFWTPGTFTESLFKDVQLRRSEATKFAWSFFAAFMVLQLGGVLLITPAYTAVAIAQEKERRTLEFLLVTELSNREIVLGTLAARLANLLLIILTGLPVVSLLPFLGGVDPALILTGFVATLMTTLSVGSLSILVSVYATRPLPAVLLTYAAVLPVVFLTAPMTVINYANPLALPVILTRSLDAGHSLGVTLLAIVVAYFVFHGLVAVVCCRWAIAAVRDAYLGAAGRPADPLAPDPGFVALSQAKARALARERRIPVREVDGWGPLPADEPLTLLPADDVVVPATGGWGPFPDGAGEIRHPYERADTAAFGDYRPWARVSVGDDGLLWKETGGNHNWLRGLYALRRPGIALALAAAFAVLLGVRLAIDWYSPGPGEGLGDALNPLVRGLGTVVFCGGLVVVALNAAGRVTREREQNTLDSLRTTPLDSSEILFAKWLASVWSVRPLAWFFLVVWGFGVLTGGLHPAALPLLLGATAVYYACLATVGLWFSTTYRTSLRATLFTVLAALVLVTGPGLLGKVFFADASGSAAPAWDERLVSQMLSPALTLWSLAFHSGDLLRDKDRLPMLDVAASVAGVYFYLLLTVILWASLRTRFDAEKGPPPLPEMTKSEIPNDERMTKPK